MLLICKFTAMALSNGEIRKALRINSDHFIKLTLRIEEKKRISKIAAAVTHTKKEKRTLLDTLSNFVFIRNIAHIFQIRCLHFRLCFMFLAIG